MPSTQNKLMALDDIMAELECMVCVEIMAPPINMCVLGHSFCHSCKSKLTSCPNCRSELSNSRNYSLENIYNKMLIPCKNEGCGQEFKGTNLKNHEENCEFSMVCCPLGAICNCLWRGQRRQILAHCQEKHASNTFKNQTNIFWPKSKNLSGLDGDSFCFLIEAHGQLFKAHCEINKDTGVTRWVMIDLDSQKDSNQFHYEIKFNGLEQVCVLRKPCQTNNRKWFEAEHSVVMQWNLLRKFFVSCGLNYTLTIRKREDTEEVAHSTANIENVVVPVPSMYLDIDDPALAHKKRVLMDILQDDARFA